MERWIRAGRGAARVAVMTVLATALAATLAGCGSRAGGRPGLNAPADASPTTPPPFAPLPSGSGDPAGEGEGGEGAAAGATADACDLLTPADLSSLLGSGEVRRSAGPAGQAGDRTACVWTAGERTLSVTVAPDSVWSVAREAAEQAADQARSSGLFVYEDVPGLGDEAYLIRVSSPGGGSPGQSVLQVRARGQHLTMTVSGDSAPLLEVARRAVARLAPAASAGG